MITNNATNMPCVENALHLLVPGATWAVHYQGSGECQIEWIDNLFAQPGDEHIAARVAQLQAEWDRREYITLRLKAYPPLGDFADATYWQHQGDESKMAAYLAKIDAVKLAYPKPVIDEPVPVVVPTPEYVHRDQPPQAGEEPI